MKHLKLSALLAAAAICGASLSAQDPNAVIGASPAEATPPAPAPVKVDGLIYVAKMPSTAQLMQEAEAEKMTILHMEQAADRIIVTYRYASGNVRTFAYTNTPPVNPETQGAAVPPAPTKVVTTAPSPTYTVIYSEPAPVYYYPRPYYSSLSIGLGFGYGYGYGYPYPYYGRPYPYYRGHYGHYHGGHGGYHGGYRGGSGRHH